MDSLGTDGADSIDQRTLDASVDTIRGRGGNDSIAATTANVIAGPGNDTITGLGQFATAAYWDSPSGVLVDLAQGAAQDGFGTTDTLVSIRTVHGSYHADHLLGSAANESFFGGAGDDLIDGRGGIDTVRFLLTERGRFIITVHPTTSEITVTGPVMNDGNDGTKTLRNIEYIEFYSGANTQTIAVSSLFPSGFTTYATPRIHNGDAAANPRWVSGDFNGDGRTDFALRYDPAAAFSSTLTGSGPLWLFLQRADGAFQLAASSATDNLAPTLVNRIVGADFNRDGKMDIAVAASGQDPYENGRPVGPWPGEVSYVLMSGAGSHSNIHIPGNPRTFAHHASKADIDLDGDVDVFIASITAEDGKESYFLVNDGQGGMRFSRAGLPNLILDVPSEVLEQQGSTVRYDSNRYTASYLFDANGDGAPDLTVLPMGDAQNGKVFLNDGLGRFNDAAVIELPAGPYGAGSGTRSGTTQIASQGSIYLDATALDVNGDGRLDLVSIVSRNQQDATQFRYYEGAAVQILINTGAGFADESAQRTDFHHAPGLNYSHYDVIEAADVDRDGFADLLVSRSDASVDNAAATRILRNDGTGRFHEKAYPVGVPAGVFTPVDLEKGLFAIANTELTGRDATTGGGSFGVDVTSAWFDYGAGRDFFTGALRPSGSPLQSDRPGRWVHGTSADDTITLSSGNESGFGYAGNDTLSGGAGGDRLDGGNGLDVALYSGSRATYRIDVINGAATVADASNVAGIDTLVSIERLHFADGKVALDLQGAAGTVAKILGATFGAASVRNADYVGIGLSLADGGVPDSQLMDLALKVRLGNSASHAAVVDLLYTNVVGTAPSPSERATFVGLLENGSHSQASLGLLAAGTGLNLVRIDFTGLSSHGLEYI